MLGGSLAGGRARWQHGQTEQTSNGFDFHGWILGWTVIGFNPDVL
jgi:hypothetical protein